MRTILLILSAISIFAFSSCDKPPVEKPDNLIPEDKMISMLADIHLAEATFATRRHQDSTIMNTTSPDFYQSVLKEYNVTDTIFEKSYVYYASQPKKFEKMYQQVMNKLNEMEQEFSGRKNEKLELEPQK